MLVTPLCMLLFRKLSCLLPPHAHVRPYMGMRGRACTHTRAHTPHHSSIQFRLAWKQQNSQGPNKKGLEGFCLL